MKLDDLKADCEKCAALCCVALAFDKSEQFAIDKPAGTACRNLDAGHRCSIHATLADAGFSGCVAYDCLGAGQRVVQHVFAGKSWRDSPELLPQMMDAFRQMRLVHGLLEFILAADALQMSAAQSAERRSWQDRLDPPQGWTADSLRTFEASDAEHGIRRFLASLKGIVKR